MTITVLNISAKRKYREYYDMIMDDFNIGEGLSLLSGQFHRRHEKVIDELFEKLTIDDEGGKTLEEFTDYRTYMDYDIRITHSDGNYYYYSRVSEEKKAAGRRRRRFMLPLPRHLCDCIRARSAVIPSA